MFYPVSEFPMHGAGPVTRYPGQWDDKQVMAACCALFTPASGAFSGRQTAFLYYRATDDLLSGPGSVQIGVMTADPADLDGLNWNRQRGLNPIIPANAVASAPVLGGDYNDMTVVEYAGKLRLFVNIYGNPSGSNRMVVFESASGLAFTYLQEVQHAGTHFGATCGPIWNVAGTLWGLFSQSAATGGNKKRLRSSADGGLSWTDHGTAIELSTDPKAWDSHSLIVGRPFPWAVGDSHVYALIPGMRNIGTDGGGSPYSDWPEAIGLYRCAVDQLGQPGSWQRYPRPVMMRGPLDGGIWQLAPLVIGREVLATYQAWSMADFDNIASADMVTLRSQPYAGVTEGWSTKHIYTARLGGRAALDDWATDPLPAGAVYLRHVATGAFLAIEGGRAVLSAEAPQVFTHASEGGFSTLTAGSTRLRAPSLENRAQIEASADDLTGDPLNLQAHWLINLREDQAGVPPLVWVQSRHSSLALAVRRGTDRSGIAIEQRPYVGAADMLWELVAHRPAGTTEDVVATPWPSDDIVRTTWEQTVTNKAIEVLPRAEAVSRNTAGAFSSWADGTTLLTDAGVFTRLASSSAIPDLPGWVPAGVITAAHFGIARGDATDATLRVQAMLDYACSVAQGVDDFVEVRGTGGPMKVSAPLYAPVGSLRYEDWYLEAQPSGSWGTLTYATHDILGTEHPDAPAVMNIGGRYADTPVTNNSRVAFGQGFRIDCNRCAMGGIAVSGITEPHGDVTIEGALVYHIFTGKLVSCKWTGTIYASAASVSSDENTPCFRTGRGLWNNTGDNSLGKFHGSYCRENLFLEGSPFFMDYFHVFGGWKGDGPDWNALTDASVTVTVNGSGAVTGWSITSAGAGYKVGEALYVERFVGNTALEYKDNKHQNPDNWPSLCCLVVTSVNGSGGITGLRVVKDRWNTEGRGAGYSAGLRTLYHVQRISPINIRLSKYGGLSCPGSYIDKAIVLLEGIFKLRLGSVNFLGDDELMLQNMIVLRSTAAGQSIFPLRIDNIDFSFSRTYGTYDAKKIIYVDETAGAFSACAAHIGLAKPNAGSGAAHAFPTTIGATERLWTSKDISGTAGAFYIDWDLGKSGFAGELYRLPAAKRMRFTSKKSPSFTFEYRYLADSPEVAPAITDRTTRRHTVRLYIPDAIRNGGDVITAEWLGLERISNANGAPAEGRAYRALPARASDAPDFSFLWTGANAGIVGDFFSARGGVTVDGSGNVSTWSGLRGALAGAQASTGLRPAYGSDARGMRYLAGNGAAYLQTGALDLSAKGKVTLLAAMTNMQDAAAATLINQSNTATGSFRLLVPSSTGYAYGASVTGGAGSVSGVKTMAASPQPIAMIAEIDLIAGTIAVTVNHYDEEVNVVDFGGITAFANAGLGLLARYGSTSAVTGYVYSLGVFGGAFTAAEKAEAMRLLAAEAGAVI